MQNKTAVCISCEQDSHIKKFLRKEASIMPVYCMFPLLKIKVIMRGKLFQRCTHLLYCSVLSLGGNVNIRRMSKPDMGSIFHIKNQWNILVIGNYYVNYQNYQIQCFYPPRMHLFLLTNSAQRELVSICTQIIRNCNFPCSKFKQWK